MGIEIIEIGVGSALFIGIFLAILFSYHRLETGRSEADKSAQQARRTLAKPSFFAETTPPDRAAPDPGLLQAEHPPRRPPSNLDST